MCAEVIVRGARGEIRDANNPERAGVSLDPEEKRTPANIPSPTFFAMRGRRMYEDGVEDIASEGEGITARVLFPAGHPEIPGDGFCGVFGLTHLSRGGECVSVYIDLFRLIGCFVAFL